jgi:hypothetical protein
MFVSCQRAVACAAPSLQVDLHVKGCMEVDRSTIVRAGLELGAGSIDRWHMRTMIFELLMHLNSTAEQLNLVAGSTALIQLLD